MGKSVRREYRLRAADPTRRATERGNSVVGGGVRAPGGLRRLQSGWDGRSPSGGFDSRPPPLVSVSRGTAGTLPRQHGVSGVGPMFTRVYT